MQHDLLDAPAKVDQPEIPAAPPSRASSILLLLCWLLLWAAVIAGIWAGGFEKGIPGR